MIHYGTILTDPIGVLPMPDEYLGPTDAARMLRVSRATFYRLWEAGELESVTLYRPTPRRPMFLKSDLEKWIAARGGKVDAPATEQK